jgi:vacuolar protein sorting-associated protein 35
MSTVVATTEEEQLRFLEGALKAVKEHAFYMKRAMDSDSLTLALGHATDMLRELRTSLLTPKNYYELYMKILDEMRELEEYLNSLQRSGKSIVQIYEQVQCCAAIVPRLYLLCCVGGVYIASKEAPAKDILKDLIEMIKGVQHPTRGLFLRNYLTQISKNKLPDVGSPYEGEGGGIQDAYSFLLQNFIETNRLWVRLQTQGASKDRKKREKERMDLRILVGTNLVRISQLEGLDVNEYKLNVLPKILEETLSCKDTIAQSYLMDCIIQVFPDDFHLATLESLLNTCGELKEKVCTIDFFFIIIILNLLFLIFYSFLIMMIQKHKKKLKNKNKQNLIKKVNVRSILESLMDRLANHALTNHSSSPTNNDQNSFELFNDCIVKLVEARQSMSITDVLRLLTVLTNFALKCYPTNIEYVSRCLTTSGNLIEKSNFLSTTTTTTTNAQQQDAATSNNNNNNNNDVRSTNETTIQIEALLSSPLKSLALRVLEIPSYGKLMSYLPWGNWKEVSATLLKAVIVTNSPLNSMEQVQQLFKMITPLIRDKEGSASVSTLTATNNDEEQRDVSTQELPLKFKEEQYLVARIPHLMKHLDTDVLLQLLVTARTNFTNGGSVRMHFTFPSLVFAALSLARRVHQREKNVASSSSSVNENNEDAQQTTTTPPQFSTRKIFHFVIEVITALATSHPHSALKLFLNAAHVFYFIFII